jgi:hypothetical protein
MKMILVRYSVKEDKAEENINYIKAVFAALKNPALEALSTLRYARTMV